MKGSLKKNEDFQRVYHNGNSQADRYLVMYVRDNGRDLSRLGISVSRRVGNSVVRHRVTRLIRESYRINRDSIKNGVDLVVVARASAKGASFKEIENALLRLAKKQNILLV